MTELARSLIDAAAAADWQAHNAAVLAAIGQKGSLDEKRRRISQARSRAAVVAVLETLAAECDPVAIGPDSTEQKLLTNADLRRLSEAVRGVAEKGTEA